MFRAFLIALFSVFPALSPAAQPIALLDSLRADSALLDRLTGTQTSLNRVKLLHLGMRAMPARLELLRNAEKFIFVSVPYWYGDESGESLFSAFSSTVHRRPGLDLRILEDWTSPGSTGDVFGLKMFSRLRDLAGGKAMLWNSPSWGRNFSWKLIQNRLHDKMFIVDGTKLIMGGMNYGDSYLQGGVTRKGWHDTDVLIEGPAAAAAGRIFVKLWEFSRYLSNPANPFPEKNRGRQSLEDYFYHDREVFDFVHERTPFGPIQHEPVHIPYSGQLRALGIDEVHDVSDVDGGVPVRLIYDNPLFNQALRSGKLPYCRFECVLDFLFQRTHESVRLFLPYLTLTPDEEASLIRVARRGVKVELITNSSKSNDIGMVAYLAAVSHYLPLLEAGVHIYEWQGLKPLEALEEANDCEIPEGAFPGKTIHTKSVILDGQVGIVGSNNMNVRSEVYNSEIMAVVADPAFAGELNRVFEQDLDLGAHTIACGRRSVVRPRLVSEAKIPVIREFVRRNQLWVDLARKIQMLF